MGPRLLTFDVFGTVVDWQRGVAEAARSAGIPQQDTDFDRLVDHQAAAQAADFRSYTDLTAESLQQVLGFPAILSRPVAENCGKWPLFPDVREGLRELMAVAPCIAMTNSDRVHGDQVQGQLGFKLTDWLCAEQVRAYKPAPRFWQAVRELRRREFGPDWWHVSAYGDFDLEVAWALGLTCIFVDRPHQRPGRHHHWVADFRQLAEQIRGGSLEYLNVA